MEPAGAVCRRNMKRAYWYEASVGWVALSRVCVCVCVCVSMSHTRVSAQTPAL